MYPQCVSSLCYNSLCSSHNYHSLVITWSPAPYRIINRVRSYSLRIECLYCLWFGVFSIVSTPLTSCSLASFATWPDFKASFMIAYWTQGRSRSFTHTDLFAISLLLEVSESPGHMFSTTVRNCTDILLHRVPRRDHETGGTRRSAQDNSHKKRGKKSTFMPGSTIQL